MSTIEIGIAGIIVFLLLTFIGLPIGFSFVTVGFLGVLSIKGLVAGLSLLGRAPYVWTASYVLCIIPLFVLMGQFAYYSGISKDLYTAAYRWTGKLPGGLALATTLACTGFAACTGSSVASAATMSTLAFPEMAKRRYSPRLSTGCIAAGGTLGILIPPSTIFIIYGIITETSINELFIAGIIPGIMISVLFCVLILLMCKKNPHLGPPGEGFTWMEKFASLKGIWGMSVLFILIIGGLYIGIFAPSEAGAIGAFGAFGIALSKRGLTWDTFRKSLKETAQFTSFAFLILIGAMMFSQFLTLSGLPQAIVQWITNLDVPPFGILLLILFFYIPLGCTMDALPMILLTLPIVFPIVSSLGFDPVWFGVLIVILSEMSLITPPIGINMYVVQGTTKVPIQDVALGILPFVGALIVGLALIIAIPNICLLLPSTMR